MDPWSPWPCPGCWGHNQALEPHCPTCSSAPGTLGLPNWHPPDSRRGVLGGGGMAAPGQPAEPLVQGWLCRQSPPCLPGLQLLLTTFIASKPTLQRPADGNVHLPHRGKLRLHGAPGKGPCCGPAPREPGHPGRARHGVQVQLPSG